MLVKLASEENQNAEGTSVDFYLNEAETQELEETGYVVIDEEYCVVNLDGDYMVFKVFKEWSGMTLHCNEGEQE